MPPRSATGSPKTLHVHRTAERVVHGLVVVRPVAVGAVHRRALIGQVVGGQQHAGPLVDAVVDRGIPGRPRADVAFLARRIPRGRIADTVHIGAEGAAEGIADFARDHCGVDNVSGGWVLPAQVKPEHRVDTGYRVTGALLKWSEAGHPGRVKALDAALRKGSYTPALWEASVAQQGGALRGGLIA